MTSLYRFKRSGRLLTSADYSRVFSKHIKVSDRHFIVLVAYRKLDPLAQRLRDGQGEETGPEARLGMAIAKKRAKRAVDRNRLKRVVRDYFRHHHKSVGSVDLVVLNRDAAIKASNAELRKSLDLLWQKIQLQLPQ